MDPETVVGVDASKDYLDIALHPQREHWRYPNNAKGLTALMARLHPFQPVRVILEATGRYETLAVLTLARAGFPIVVADPRHTRGFAQSSGNVVKGERLGATTLAHFGATLHPEPRSLTEEQALEMDELLDYRAHLVKTQVIEMQRLRVADYAPVRSSISEYIALLDQHIENVDQALRELVQRSLLSQ
jgi:transposase